MKIWKKILKLATVGVAVFALAACGNKTEEKTEAQAPAQEASVEYLLIKHLLVTLMKMVKIKVMMFISQIV